VFAALPQQSVSAIVTSPPYNLGVSYRSYDDALPRDRYLEWTGRWIAAARRVLDPAGSLFLNVGAKPTDPWTGMEVAMAADLVYAADDATFGQPEIQLGVFPPFAAALYPSWFGRARAAELVLLGETMSAKDAFARGLVTGVVPAAELTAKVDAVCAKLAALSPSSLRIAREALRLGGSHRPVALPAVEALYRDKLMKTEDAREGLAAFLEKRAPKWRGH